MPPELDRRQRIARMYFEDRLTLAQIGAEFGISRQRVSQLLAGFEGERHHGSLRRREEAERTLAAHERVVKGESTVAEEAKKFGIGANSLYNRFSRAGLSLPLPEIEHGTIQCYWRGCRQPECREANRLYARTMKNKEPPHHGTESGYRNYRCRCNPCKAAAKRAVRERKRRKENA